MKKKMSYTLFSFEVRYERDETDATLTFSRPLPLDGFVPANVQDYINDFYKLFSSPQTLTKVVNDVHSKTFGQYIITATFSRNQDPTKIPNLNIIHKRDGVIFNLSGKSSIGKFTPASGSPLYEYAFRENEYIAYIKDNFVWNIDLMEIFVKGNDDGSAILYRGNDPVNNFRLPPTIDKVLQAHSLDIVQEFNKLRRSPNFSKINKISPTYEVNGLSINLNVGYDLEKDQAILESYSIFVPQIFSSMCRGGFRTTTLPYSAKDDGYVLTLPMSINQLTNFRVNDASGRYNYNGYIVVVEVGNTVKSFLYNQSGNLPTPIVKTGPLGQRESRQASLVFKRPPGLTEASLSARTKDVTVVSGVSEFFDLKNGRLNTDKYVEIEGLTLAYIKATCQSSDCEDKSWKGYVLFSKSNRPIIVVDMIQTKGEGLELVPGRDQNSTFIRFKDSSSNTYYPLVNVDISHCVLTT